MRRCLAVVFGCASLWSRLAWSQPAPPQNWALTGTVTDSLSGKPIADAVVLWEPSFASYGFRDRPIESDTPSANAARLTTDASGAFTLSIEPTATGVRLFVSHAGYRTQDGKPLAALSVRALSVRAGSPPVAIRLAPQSSIQGRITNTAGDPIAGIGVNLARVEIHDGRRQARVAFAKLTGQDGAFAFEDVPPGAYAVRAAGQAAGKSYGPVYYPSAVTQDQARLLRAEPGKAITADFRLENHVPYRIRGIVTNMPLRRTVAIRLLRGDDPVGETAPVGPNGTFEVLDVPAGSYTLQAYTPDIVPLDLGEAAVTVEDRDAVAVKVALNEGEDISGHIDFHGPGSLEKYAVVYATPFHPRHWPGEVKDTSAVMNPKGNFVLKNLQPGKYEISVRGLPNFYLAEMHTESRGNSQGLVSEDILGKGLSVPASYPPALDIVMKSAAAEITGTIEGANTGELFSVALVVMRGDVAIPTILRAPDGRFRVGGLTPGDYTLLAWPDSREVEYRNAAVLSDLLPHGTPVSVGEDGKRNVYLARVQ
jgi:hypothetical protein